MKKHISLALVLTMLITAIFSNTVFAAFPDVDATNKYYKAILTLQNLKILDGDEAGKFNPQNQITRAEFTKMLVCAMGYGDFTTEPTEFSDLSDHWAKCYIKTAYDLGIVDGFDDGTFKPNDPVTYEQSLKMMVCAIGYDVNAKDKGGWPNGYIQQASDLGMTKGISDQKNKEPALRQIIAQVVYNSLEVYKQELQNNGSVEVTTKTLLNDNLKVYKLKGTLVGVETNTTNDCTLALNQYQIDIKADNGEETVIDMYEYAKTMTVAEMAKQLGNYMTVYYKQASNVDDKELVIVDLETTTNTTYTISYDDIIEYDGSQFKYYLPKSSTKKYLKVDASTVTVRYNGQTLEAGKTYTIESKSGTSTKTVTKEEAVMEWFDPNSEYFIYGDVTMTDSGSKGEISLLSINDYEVMIALKTPVTTDYRLQNKLITGDYLDLNPNQVDKDVYIEKNGKAAQATSISANDIVSYTESLDGATLNLYINTDNKITGAVTSINTNDYKITIGGTEYNLGKTCLDDVYAKEGKNITTNSNITAYTDKLGTVVYATVNTTDEIPYAYISNVAIDMGTDEANIVVFLPKTSATSAKKYPLANKVTVSANLTGTYQTKTYSSAEEVADVLKQTAAYSNDDANYADKIYGADKVPSNTEYSQIARVKVNSAGEVSEIVTLDNAQNSKQNEDNQFIAKCYPLKKYYYTSNSFKENSSSSTLFSMNSNTLIIYVPQDRSLKDKYAKKAASSSTFTSGESYWVEAYDVNSSRYSNVIILYGTSGSVTTVSKTTEISVVGATPSQYYDSDTGDTVQKVPFYTASNAVKEWTTATATEFADVVPGDVMQFGYDADQKIQGRKKVIDYADIKAILDGKTTEAVYTTEEGEQKVSELYNWTEEFDDQTAENRYQKYMFDFRYPKDSVKPPTDNYYQTYTSTTYGEIPYTQACMYNVYKVLTDSNKLQVTKEGFDASTNQMRDSEKVDIEEYTISASAKIIRMEDNETSFSKYVEGTQTELTVTDLKAAVDYGIDCSKILVCAKTGTVKLIVIYD